MLLNHCSQRHWSLACCRPEWTADQVWLWPQRTFLLILLLDLRATCSNPHCFSDSFQSLRTSGSLKKVSAFFLYRSVNMMYKSTVILLLGVSAVKALITRLSLAVRPMEALWSDLSPTKQTLHRCTTTLLKAFDLGRHFMFSQLLLIICQALCKGCDKHV